jgi:MHS family proline/betaine transporter-like MFS transporter
VGQNNRKVLMSSISEKQHTSSSRLAGTVGNIIEWYDFALFGYFASIIAPLFFPTGNATSSVLATWAVFAGGFLMRPIGASVFGYIGDRIGRRKVLFLSAVLMALPTFCLGILPTHEQIGIWAAVLLVTVRLVQGFSVGGEFTGSVTYMVETAPQDRRGLAGSWANVGSMTGILLGSGVATLVTSLLAHDEVISWGWRIPFLFGGLLGIISLLMVRRLHEVHIEKRDEKHAGRSPIKEALTVDARRTILSIFFVAGYGVVFYIPLVYLPTYVNEYSGISLSNAMKINTIATIILLLFIPLMAIVSDKFIRRKKILVLGFVTMSALSYPLFLLLQHDSLFLVSFVQIIFGLLIAIPLGTAPAMLVELFPTDDRLTAYSLSYNIGSGVIGGTTPFIATWLIDATGSSLAPCFYLAGWSIVAFLALVLMRDRSREPLI